MRGRPLNVVMGFYFYPRGGSAYVVGNLCRTLGKAGHEVRLVTGSLGTDGPTSAGEFFHGVDIAVEADYAGAIAAWERGDDPLVATPPLHGSYEDRPGVPDRILAALPPAGIRHQETFWRARLGEAGLDRADVAHVHHLTPQGGAVVRASVPVVAHLHGTELKFLEACQAAAPPDGWDHARVWATYLAGVAAGATRLITVSDGDAAIVGRLLPKEAGKVVVLPNGIDPAGFHPRPLTTDERRELWRRWLVDDPRGWDESGRPGSIGYDSATVDRLFPPSGDRLTIISVARFLDFKRLPMLVRAYAAARDRMGPSTLVVWGGFPGECEGEHPVAVARDLGLDDVVFTGHRPQGDLALAYNASDLCVSSANHEPFGQTLLEAMASRLPIVAARSGGPATFVSDAGPAPTGWLFTPDDADDLADKLVVAGADRGRLSAFGERAAEVVTSGYTWDSIAGRLEGIYEDAIRARLRSPLPGGA